MGKAKFVAGNSIPKVAGSRHQQGYIPLLEKSLWRENASEAKRLRELQKENSRLNKLPTEKELDIDLL